MITLAYWWLKAKNDPTLLDPTTLLGDDTSRWRSFVATSNEEALEPQVYKGYEQPLTTVLQQDTTLRQTFTDPETEKAAKPVIIQSSAHAGNAYSSSNGLVSTVISAYNTHHKLTLRADDVWQAILTQFSFYLNANAEELRNRIVDFEGKKELVIVAGGTLFTADFGNMARRMVDEQIVKNIKDPSVARWLLPAFSTTTETDRITASVSVMATLQAYFD